MNGPGADRQIRELLQAELTPAMKARDTLKVSVLRTTLAAVANAEAVPLPPSTPGAPPDGPGDVPRLALSQRDIRDIVEGEYAQLLVDADRYASLGRGDEAAALRAQAALLRGYLDG